MILGHADLRAAAKDWQTFSSDAPFRVPIPSEESMRTMRQLPIEYDPARARRVPLELLSHSLSDRKSRKSLRKFRISSTSF